MKKIFIANLTTQNISLSRVDPLAKKSSLIQEIPWQSNHVLLVKRLKEVFKREKKSERNLYIVLNNENFAYHRYVSDVKKSKAELATLLELPEHEVFSYQEKKSGNEYVYFILSLNKNILEKYTSLLKKLELSLLCVLPLDLILIQKKQAGIYLQQEQSKNIVFKIIDQAGNYYLKYFLNEEDFDKNKERLLIYLKREKIVLDMEELPIKEAETPFNHELFVGINYFDERQLLYKKRIKSRFNQGVRLLSFKQKLLLLFIAAFLFSVLFSLALKSFKILRINHDIVQYNRLLVTNAQSSKELSAMEKNTHYLRSLEQNSSVLPLVVLNEAAAAGLVVKKILLHQGKALAFTGIDKGENMAVFIKALKKSSAVSAVNLVDVAYYKDYLEFKLVITGKIK